jgi:hypothetical protein
VRRDEALSAAHRRSGFGVIEAQPATVIPPATSVETVRTKNRLYLAAIVAALAAYLFVSLAFSGTFNFLHGGVFMVFFAVVMVAFARFIAWSETLETD